MMMMMMTHQLVAEKLARKTWARLWLLRRQEKGAFYTSFRELSVEDSDGFCEYMRTPYATVDAMLIFEHESRVPKELWMKILANLIG